MLAQLKGTLTIVDGHCYGLETQWGTLLVVFPTGSYLDSDDRVHIPGLEPLGLGDAVDGGGGSVSAGLAPISIPQECASDEVAILNPFD